MRLVLLFLCLLPAVSAANLTGTWIGAILSNDPRRLPQDLAFQFQQHGAALTGKQYGDDLSSAIQDGAIEDGTVRFSVVLREQAGNQVNDVLYQFEGAIEGDAIELTRERASAKDSVSGSPVPVRRPNDTDEEDRKRRIQTVRLERLF
jgi:hypothetical protein